MNLFFGILISLFFGVPGGILVGLLAVVLSGLDVRVMGDALIYFQRFWFWRSHFLPWHIVDFLEHARACHLLLRDGENYRFIHGLLLDYFADLKDEA